MSRIMIFLLLMGLAALAAAIFGAVHNQLSFTVGPDYFYEIKFRQFGIAEALPDRVGAAIVGVLASWWMGVLVGLPAFFFGLFAVPVARAYFAAGIGAIGFVILLTTSFAALGLFAGVLLTGNPILDFIPIPPGAEPADIQRAGLMHDASYLGGAVGAIVAFWPMIRARRAGQVAHAA